MEAGSGSTDRGEDGTGPGAVGARAGRKQCWAGRSKWRRRKGGGGCGRIRSVGSSRARGGVRGREPRAGDLDWANLPEIPNEHHDSPRGRREKFVDKYPPPRTPAHASLPAVLRGLWTSTPTCLPTPPPPTTPARPGHTRARTLTTTTPPSSSATYISHSTLTAPRSRTRSTTSTASAAASTASSSPPRTARGASAAAADATRPRGTRNTPPAPARGATVRGRGREIIAKAAAAAATESLMRRGGESFCQRPSAPPCPSRLFWHSHRARVVSFLSFLLTHRLVHAHIHLDKCFLLDQCDELVTGYVIVLACACAT